MTTSRLVTPLLLLLVISFGLASSSCVTVQDGNACSVAGKLTAGGVCAKFISDQTHLLSFSEMIDLLEAQGERTCVPVGHMSQPDKDGSTQWVMDLPVCDDDQTHGTAMKLPARGASVIMPTDDFGNLKTEAEEMCRELGKRCSKAAQKVLERLSRGAIITQKN